MDLLDTAPSLPSYDPEAESAILAGRRPGMGEYLGAAVGEGWWNTLPGIAAAMVETKRDGQGGEPLTRDAWRASPHFREGLSYDDRMTENRAAAMARVFDDNRYRRAVMGARQPGALETVLGFGAMLLGSVPDPLNFIPIAGPAARGLRAGEAALEAGRLARGLGVAARSLEAPGVAAGMLRGAVEGFGGNLLAAPAVYSAQSYFGDEITFSSVMTDLALGALVGAGFGGVGGALSRAIQPEPAAAARILDVAARDMAAGREVEVPAELAGRAINDAILRSAPPEVTPFLRTDESGHPVGADLPTRADGKPLTREEFEATLAERAPDLAAAREEALTAAAQADKATGRANGLIAWIVKNGGMRDDGGELKTLLGGTTRTRPGLISKNGMAPDILALRAREAGFFQDFAVKQNGKGEALEPDRLTPRDVYDAIDAELRGLGQRQSGGYGLEEKAVGSAVVSTEAELSRAMDEAYGWYREAHALQQHVQRLASAMRDDIEERAAIMQFEGGMGRDEAYARAARDTAKEDPDLAAAAREIERMRAEGRFTAADEALLKAGDEAAADAEALAKGIEEAAACMLARVA